MLLTEVLHPASSTRHVLVIPTLEHRDREFLCEKEEMLAHGRGFGKCIDLDFDLLPTPRRAAPATYVSLLL